jgi:prepilin signal peptidase PulO-like enzyme (type II secretory pathway)
LSYLLYFLVFVLGLFFGSFLNVVIFRMDRIATVFRGRSKCPRCHNELAWFDLIPVLSYFSLRGRCRYCKKAISLQYPIVEIATGLLGLVSILTFGWTPLALSIFAYLSVLLVIFAYDLRNQMIPDAMVLIATILSLPVAYFLGHSIQEAGLGVLVSSGFLGLLYLLGRGKWMGLGDVKLGIPLGIVAGLWGSILLLSVAFGSGALVGLTLLLLKKARAKSAIPFGPFLVIGSFIALFYGESIISWYLTFF